LDLEVHADPVTDDETAAFERDVEIDSEVLAAELGPGAEADAGTAPRIGADAVELEIELDRLGDLTNGEITGDEVAVTAGLHRRRAEGHLRVVLDREEVARAQVLVAPLVAGVDRGEVDLGLDRRLQRILGDVDPSFEGFEQATNSGHGEVTNGEADLGVTGVGVPDTGGNLGY